MTVNPPQQDRVFLFLQGPHGPFFDQLARQLRRAGADTWRAGFNISDEIFWRRKDRYIAHRNTPEDWSHRCAEILDRLRISDLVLYGDARPVHAEAIRQAQKRDIRIHIFEEGYLRPYWITYEHGGANGFSHLMRLSIANMQDALADRGCDQPPPPCHWGDMRQHVFFGALYHGLVLAWNRAYPGFRPHRSLNVAQEFELYVKRLTLMPFHAFDRWRATRAVRSGNFPYHLVLLQLAHDSSFQNHGPFRCQADFISTVIDGFAAGAPAHHHLVFKEHPLEDGRAPLARDIRRFAKDAGLADRVHLLRGGKLAAVLNDARSAVTVNSTAGQQALWRGLPLRALGQAVYCKPELVSSQPLQAFFADPVRPDTDAYRCFRDFLLNTSQLPGSYYAAKGRAQVIRRVVDMMLCGEDPYELRPLQNTAEWQQLRVVGS